MSDDEVDHDWKRRRLISRNKDRERTPNISNEKIISFWQDQQLARALFDNSINSMIESMGLPPDSDFRDRADLEAEAVRVAIMSHGLQKCTCHGTSELRKRNAKPEPQPERKSYDEPSTSSIYEPTIHNYEEDVLLEAVNAAIQNKGLENVISSTY